LAFLDSYGIFFSKSYFVKKLKTNLSMAKKDELLHSASRVNDPSVIEDTIAKSKRAKKAAEKSKEGTLGVDALDEIHESERLKEGFSMMNPDD